MKQKNQQLGEILLMKNRHTQLLNTKIKFSPQRIKKSIKDDLGSPKRLRIQLRDKETSKFYTSGSYSPI